MWVQTQLLWRKQTFLPYKALFGPEQLDGGQWTGRAAGMGGTSGWHRHLAKAGVPGLEFLGSGRGAREGCSAVWLWVG